MNLNSYIPIMRGYLQGVGYSTENMTNDEIIIKFYLTEVNPEYGDTQSKAEPVSLIGLALAGVTGFFQWLTGKQQIDNQDTLTAAQLQLQQQALQIQYQLEKQKFNGFLILAVLAVSVFIILKK